MITTRTVLLGASAIATVLLAAACSSSGSGTSTNAQPGASTFTNAQTGTSQSTSAEPKAEPITVGLICSCSGAFGSNLQAGQKNYEAWVKTVNAAGGINGHPIDLIEKDDTGNPGTSTTYVQAFVKEDHVDVIEDQSLVDQAWASFAESAKVPVIGLGNVNSDFYPVGQTNDSITYAVGATVKASGAQNFGTLYCVEAPVCQESVPLLKKVGEQLGVPQSYTNGISATAPNYTAQCLAAQQANVDALFIGDSPAIVARVAQDCARQNYHPIYVTEGLGFSRMLLTAPVIKDNLWSEYNGLPFWADSPATRAMNVALDKYYPGLRQNADIWSEEAALQWPTGLLLEHALRAARVKPTDTIDPATVIAGLHALKGDTLDGWTSPLTYPAGQQHTINCWFVGNIRNGRTILGHHGKPVCEPE